MINENYDINGFIISLEAYFSENFADGKNFI